MNINQGIVPAQKNSAFGPPPAGPVAWGGTLELSNGLDIPAETLNLNGSAEVNNGFAMPLHVLNGPHRANVWEGTISLNTGRTAIMIDAGSTLILNGVVTDNGFNKLGAGTFSLGGPSPNTLRREYYLAGHGPDEQTLWGRRVQ